MKPVVTGKQVKLSRTDINQVKRQVPQTLKAIESSDDEDEDEEESESSEEEPPVKQPAKKVLRVKGPKLTQAKLNKTAPIRATRSKTRKDATMQQEESPVGSKSKPTAAVKTSLRSKLKLGEKRAKPADDDIESDESG